MGRPVAATKVSARRAASRKPAVAIDFGPLAGWFGFHLRMAQLASFQSFREQARNIDLSPGRFAALTVIGRNPGISQTALSRSIGADKSTMTPALDYLVKRHLVRRSRTENDKRT